MPDTDIELLLTATDSTSLLRSLYTIRKQANRNFSFAYLCKKMGVSSKGYLSDVINGKKILGKRYSKLIGPAFGLDQLESLTFEHLIERDHAKTEATKLQHDIELTKCRKSLSARNAQLLFSDPAAFQSFELFCAFGLFNGKPQRQQLEAYYGEDQRERLESDLSCLKKMGLVEDHGDTLSLVDNLVFFKGVEQAHIHIKFLRDAITRAKDNVALWYKKDEDAYFESTIISVKEDDYREALQGLRTQVMRFKTDLESEQADKVIRINIQVYPT